MACGDLLLAEFVQDRGSAGALISYYFVTGAFFQLLDQLLRETVIREGLKRFRRVDSHHLPVSGHSVLAVAGLGELCEAARRLFHRGNSI